ncbi:MAG: thioredoxin family protein [Acidobacteriota bacterium]|jgi:glutathione peroxidase-family protein|uniref:Thioredoxin family protein n=1 Tax=Thermoanaerobaculum aquaticum TaxID=1312852 RepID=A0A7C2SMK9_9BACT
MKAKVLAVLLVAMALGPAWALKPGDSLPESVANVKMKGVDGKEVTLKELMGAKGLLVIFSCNHCPWVKAWQARMVALGNEYSQKGVGVVAVNSNDVTAYPDDDMEHMIAQAKEHGYRFPYVMDATSDVARAFGATRTPEAFLFDAQGKLVYHGAIDDNAEKPQEVKKTYLADALAAVVAGKPVPVAETKALGCSIKFRQAK